MSFYRRLMEAKIGYANLKLETTKQLLKSNNWRSFSEDLSSEELRTEVDRILGNYRIIR